MKLLVLGILVLALSCSASVTRCPDCSTTSHSTDMSATATSPVETTPSSPAASSSEQAPPASSVAAASSTTSSAATSTTTMAVPVILPAAGREVVTVGGGMSGLATAIREHLPAHENAMMSPLSIGSLLAAVRVGARGNTGRQIGKVLGLHYGDDEVYWGQLAAALSAIHDSQLVDAGLVNAIFMEKRLVTNPDFEHQVKRAQTSEIIPLDFTADQQTISDFINQWVSNKTHTKIPNILQESVASDTVIALASALYFNGAWDDQFPKEDTKREKFTISDREEIEVDMMHHHSKALYAINTSTNAQVVGLPYQDEDFALFFLLPGEIGVTGLQDYEKRTPSSEVLHLLNSAYWGEVSYYVPRMRLETTLELNNALFGAGVNDLFVNTRADLKGMVSPVNRTAILFVNKVVHSAVLEVTEEGTEPPAAPPTGPHAVHTNGNDARVEVRADRPFLLILQHRPTGIPVVWASVVRPTPSYGR